MWLGVKVSRVPKVYAKRTHETRNTNELSVHIHAQLISVYYCDSDIAINWTLINSTQGDRSQTVVQTATVLFRAAPTIA